MRNAQSDCELQEYVHCKIKKRDNVPLSLYVLMYIIL